MGFEAFLLYSVFFVLCYNNLYLHMLVFRLHSNKYAAIKAHKIPFSLLLRSRLCGIQAYTKMQTKPKPNLWEAFLIPIVQAFPPNLPFSRHPPSLLLFRPH